MAGNDTLLPVHRVYFGAWSSMRLEIMKRSGPCNYSLQ
jgi:hypothetical protein